MRDDVKEEWIGELRDAKRLSHGVLRRQVHGQVSFCVLGHLCELYRNAKGGSWIQHPRTPTLYVFSPTGDTYEKSMSVGIPPYEVYKWSGIKDGRATELLVEMNDLGISREQIIEFINTRF